MKTSGIRTILRYGKPLAFLLFSSLCFSQTIALAPNVGPPTTKTLVSGSGFTPYAPIRIFFGRTRLSAGNADATGSFKNLGIRVPRSALPGKHPVTAGDLDSGMSARAQFLVRTDWRQYGFDAQHSGDNLYENLLSKDNVGGLQLLWTHFTGAATSTSPAVAYGILYVAGGNNDFNALNSVTGELLWTYHEEGSGANEWTPAVADGMVYFGTRDDTVYALDAKAGNLVWKYTIGPWYVGGSPVVANGFVYVVSEDYYVLALDAKTGALQWQFSMGPWAFSPAVGDGVLYVVDDYGSLYALDASSGKLLWSRWSLYSSPVVFNGVVFVGGGDVNANVVYALDAKTGTVLWTFSTDALAASGPSISDGVLYIGCNDGSVYALNATTGALVWKYTGLDPLFHSSPAVANGVLYVGSRGGHVYALSASNGVLLWTYQSAEELDSSPAVANGVLYFGGSSGNLYAFGLSERK
jgi:outer membrane protein assembly factor BamB